MDHAFYSAASHRHVQKSPFRESIVLKIKDNKTGILKADAINAIYIHSCSAMNIYFLICGKLRHKTDSHTKVN